MCAKSDDRRLYRFTGSHINDNSLLHMRWFHFISQIPCADPEGEHGGLDPPPPPTLENHKVCKDAKIRNRYNQVPHPTKLHNVYVEILVWT